jgi:hypothetical protein
MDLNKSIQIFYKNIIESLLDGDLDDDSELIMAVTMLLHEHSLRPVHRAQSRYVWPMSSATVKRVIPTLPGLLPSYQANI